MTFLGARVVHMMCAHHIECLNQYDITTHRQIGLYLCIGSLASDTAWDTLSPERSQLYTSMPEKDIT